MPIAENLTKYQINTLQNCQYHQKTRKVSDDSQEEPIETELPTKCDTVSWMGSSRIWTLDIDSEPSFTRHRHSLALMLIHDCGLIHE